MNRRRVTKGFLDECLRLARQCQDELTEESPPVQRWYARHVALLAEELIRLKGYQEDGPEPHREFLLLKAVHSLDGQPVAVFGRLELPLGTQLGCHEVLLVDADDAAKLAGLLDRLEAEQQPARAEEKAA